MGMVWRVYVQQASMTVCAENSGSNERAEWSIPGCNAEVRHVHISNDAKSMPHMLVHPRLLHSPSHTGRSSAYNPISPGNNRSSKKRRNCRSPRPPAKSRQPTIPLCIDHTRVSPCAYSSCVGLLTSMPSSLLQSEPWCGASLSHNPEPFCASG